MFVVAVLPDKRMQIDVHVLKYQVNILVVLGSDYIVQLDDIFVFKLFQEHYFTVGSLGISGVGKCIEVLF